MPEGLAVVADGKDVDPVSHHRPTHHTVYPTERMTMEDFIERFSNLPWQYMGKR